MPRVGHGGDSHQEGSPGNGLLCVLLPAALCPGKGKGGARKRDLLSLVSHNDALASPARVLWGWGQPGCLLASPAAQCVWGTSTIPASPCSPRCSCCSRRLGWGSLSLAGAPASFVCLVGLSEPPHLSFMLATMSPCSGLQGQPWHAGRA